MERASFVTNSSDGVVHDDEAHGILRDLRLMAAEAPVVSRSTSAKRALGDEPPLARTERIFELSDLETQILVFALAVEVDPRFGRLVGYLNDHAGKTRPTVGLAADVLTGTSLIQPEVLACFSDDGALCKQGLLIVGDGSHAPLADRPIRIPESFWPRLTGLPTKTPALRAAEPQLLEGLALPALLRAEAEAYLDPNLILLTEEQINDRLALIDTVLHRIRLQHPDDAAVSEALSQLQGETALLRLLTSFDLMTTSMRVVRAQQIVERCERDIRNLGLQLSAYAQQETGLGASQPHFISLTQSVRSVFLEALGGAFAPDAWTKFRRAQAMAAALPSALTEVELGILANRQAGYSMLEPRTEQMVAWVEWIRTRMTAFEADAHALAQARANGSPDIERLEHALLSDADIIQLSIEGARHWERGIRAYEFLAGGGNIIPGAYRDTATIMQRCFRMRAAAYEGNASDLRARLERHISDPNIERFYRAMPMFVGASSMLIGFGILLISAMASAGVGALVGVGEAASVTAIAGSVALEALTFTTVNRTLQGAISPPPRTSFALDLALNIGLFGLLRVTGTAIRSSLQSRGLGSVAGIAQHSSAYGILQGWGALHFRLEEGRWPTGDEIARMSAESLVMLAGVVVAARSVTRVIQTRRQLHALEAFHSRYGVRLGRIQASRTQLAERFRAEVEAGRGDDPATLETLRSEATALEAELRTVVKEVRSDPSIGIESLRTALAEITVQREAVAGELLSQSLDLPQTVALRRAGGSSQYTYEWGATPPLVERLQAMGAQVETRIDAGGRTMVVAEFTRAAPMYFAERVQTVETQAHLAHLATLIENSSTTRAQRSEVITSLRTPHEQTPGEYEGFVLESALSQNQRAIAELATEIAAENPDIIVGMERGGSFLTEALGRANPTLVSKVRSIPAHRNTSGRGGKFDAPAMQAEIEAVIASGARRISFVDVYMGGTTASSLRDQILRPLARAHPEVQFDVHWLRETVGLVGDPLRGTLRANQPGASQIRVPQPREVSMAIGDDMSIVFDPSSRQPITIFDRTGRQVRVVYPRRGQTTRDVLLELLTEPANP